MTVFRKRGDTTQSHQEDSPHGVQRGRSRDDTRGTPSAFRPWKNRRPNQGRCANEENARVFHQGPDTSEVHREADIYTQPCSYMVHHVTPRRCSEGWVHIEFVLKLWKIQHNHQNQ